MLYHFDFVGDRLIIGKFCALACGVTFLMNGANHGMAGFSTHPFFIFGHGWDYPEPPSPGKGDTVVGHDVWIGYGATILPGVKIGHGAIVAAKSVVTRDVEPYTVVGGNPARLLRRRFEEETVQALLAIAWWDWDIAKITRNLPHIVAADLAALQAAI